MALISRWLIGSVLTILVDEAGDPLPLWARWDTAQELGHSDSPVSIRIVVGQVTAQSVIAMFLVLQWYKSLSAPLDD